MKPQRYIYNIQVDITKWSIELERTFLNLRFESETTITKEQIKSKVFKKVLKEIGRVRFVEYTYELVSIETFYNYKRKNKWEV